MTSKQALTKDLIESLRLILSRECGRPFTFKEAEEIGLGLVSFYEKLAIDNGCAIQQKAVKYIWTQL